MDRLSSELLGFAPDARVLIVSCDDLGMHEAVNAAVAESIEEDIASSSSLMVPGPAAANAMRMLRKGPPALLQQLGPVALSIAVPAQWRSAGDTAASMTPTSACSSISRASTWPTPVSSVQGLGEHQ